MVNNESNQTKDKAPGEGSRGRAAVLGDDDPHGKKLITEMLQKMKEKLKADNISPTLSEFIRLVQLDREMADDDPPKEINVSWSGLKMESDIEP